MTAHPIAQRRPGGRQTVEHQTRARLTVGFHALLALESLRTRRTLLAPLRDFWRGGTPALLHEQPTNYGRYASTRKLWLFSSASRLDMGRDAEACRQS